MRRASQPAAATSAGRVREAHRETRSPAKTPPKATLSLERKTKDAFGEHFLLDSGSHSVRFALCRRPEKWKRTFPQPALDSGGRFLHTRGRGSKRTSWLTGAGNATKSLAHRRHEALVATAVSQP